MIEARNTPAFDLAQSGQLGSELRLTSGPLILALAMPTTNLQVQDRRQFLRIVTVGASAIGATLLIPNTGLRAADETEALLLSCMDYRLTDQTTRYMDKRGEKMWEVVNRVVEERGA